MKLVVGLGNPGRKYHNTRHNVGFEVLAELSRRHGSIKPMAKFQAEVVELAFAGEKVLLLAPQTYMNESGRSVGQCVGFYQLPLENLLVVCDDMNLPSGRLRMRPSGSAGGQKGLGNIIQHLGSDDFSRLRIGIGRPPGTMDASSYVLARFSRNERDLMDGAIIAAADGVEQWLNEGNGPAMNNLNAPLPKK